MKKFILIGLLGLMGLQLSGCCLACRDGHWGWRGDDRRGDRRDDRRDSRRDDSHDERR